MKKIKYKCIECESGACELIVCYGGPEDVPPPFHCPYGRIEHDWTEE